MLLNAHLEADRATSVEAAAGSDTLAFLGGQLLKLSLDLLLENKLALPDPHVVRQSASLSDQSGCHHIVQTQDEDEERLPVKCVPMSDGVKHGQRDVQDKADDHGGRCTAILLAADEEDEEDADKVEYEQGHNDTILRVLVSGPRLLILPLERDVDVQRDRNEDDLEPVDVVRDPLQEVNAVAHLTTEPNLLFHRLKAPDARKH